MNLETLNTTTETQATPPTRPEPVNFIRFHGLTLLVVRHEGIDYVAAKPLSDLAGIDWKTAKRTLSSGHNTQLYGTCRLPSTPCGQNLYLRRDRAELFLARVNTNRMRANGNVDGADALLARQKEWADALHVHEGGAAVTDAEQESLIRELMELRSIAEDAEDAEGCALLDALLREVAPDLCDALPQPRRPAPPQH